MIPEYHNWTVPDFEPRTLRKNCPLFASSTKDVCIAGETTPLQAARRKTGRILKTRTGPNV